MTDNLQQIRDRGGGGGEDAKGYKIKYAVESLSKQLILKLEYYYIIIINFHSFFFN